MYLGLRIRSIFPPQILCLLVSPCAGEDKGVQGTSCPCTSTFQAQPSLYGAHICSLPITDKTWGFFWEVLLKLFVPSLDLLLLESFAGSCLLHSLVIQVDDSEQIPQ